MTLDEKIKEIETAIERLENSGDDHSEKMLEAIAEALREERQTLKWLKDYKRLLESLENQKTGHWFIREGGNVCSNCGDTQFKYTSLDFDWRPHYCPNCGANMRGE